MGLKELRSASCLSQWSQPQKFKTSLTSEGSARENRQPGPTHQLETDPKSQKPQKAYRQQLGLYLCWPKLRQEPGSYFACPLTFLFGYYGLHALHTPIYPLTQARLRSAKARQRPASRCLHRPTAFAKPKKCASLPGGGRSQTRLSPQSGFVSLMVETLHDLICTILP